jgi:hypothetical protein
VAKGDSSCTGHKYRSKILYSHTVEKGDSSLTGLNTRSRFYITGYRWQGDSSFALEINTRSGCILQRYSGDKGGQLHYFPEEINTKE